MKPTTSMHHDTRRAKNNNKYPVKLRITYFRQRKYYKTGIDLTPSEWEKVNSPKPRGDLKDFREKITAIHKNADEIISKIDLFSFPAFEKQYYRVTAKSLDLAAAFETYYGHLHGQNRVNTAESYINAITSLKAFKSSLLMTDITPDLLRKYEEWMVQKGRSLTTVGIYLRSLRAILNTAIDDGLLKPEQYPFGKRKYQIPTGRNIKKALLLEDIAKLYYHEIPTATPKDKARDFWLFSYLANGMNFKDICRLKVSNIQNDAIVFYRAKTERTKRTSPTPIVVIITEDMQRIINKWGNISASPDNYVFPILSDGITAQIERTVIKQFIKTANKWLDKIASEVGIKHKVTTYAARHSFSTILKNGGTPIQYIKESLGHNSTQTTENYLNAFPDELKRQYTEHLTMFKKAV